MSKAEDSLEGIAVIGLSGRFPGAGSVDQFWSNLLNREESIHRFSDQELESLGITPEVYNHPDYVKAGTILENADMFDAEFFGFHPREAETREPQHRVFLECTWEALENAGYDVESYKGQIGVFAGCSPNYYGRIIPFDTDPSLVAEAYQREIANEKDYLCTLVAYKLGLRGPAMTIQTACSTSLVAVCMACQSLMTYQCDMALAGGVCVNTRQRGGYFYQEGLIPSPDGHCRAFDAKAQGTVLSQGAGVVVLKRLSEALSDGDRIRAVIKGFAVNNDGSEKVGFTAPSVNGQAEVIAMALAFSGFPPETITYIEAHGTGTPLGDPIEMAALNKVFSEYTDKKSYCAIGSLKTNLGHMDAAAGVGGLIKTVLMLENREIPPSLHFESPNPEIDFANSPFYVNTKPRKWGAEGSPLRAGVSAFGLGGTNAHVVLEEAPETDPSGPSRPRQLLTLSARTKQALDKATANLQEYLVQNPAANIADVAYTLQTGRKAFNHRRFIVCKDASDAVEGLKSLDPIRVKTRLVESSSPEVAFMFPGQGAQYVNMGLNLYEHEILFRETVDQCAELLQPHFGKDLREILYPKGGDPESAADLLRQTAFQQPAIFTIEYALAKLWEKWGVRPAAMIGHSIGEYVAACLAGVFKLEDALMLVATRGRMMQELPGGAMLSVRLPAQQVEQKLDGRLTLAAINAPSLCVVSGPTEAVQLFQGALEAEGVMCRFLHTSHAFHSPMMDPIVEPFGSRVQTVRLSPPKIPFVSTVTGAWITSSEATDPMYWGKQLRQTVRFAEGIKTLWERPERVLLEVGPRATSTTLARQQAKDLGKQVAIPSLADTADNQGEWSEILNAVGQLWLAGLALDWAAFYEEEKRHRIALPTYPFERKRFWMKPAEVQAPNVEHREIPSEEVVGNVDLQTKPTLLPRSPKEGAILKLKKSLEEASGIDLSGAPGSMTFLEMGLDSLFLTQWSFSLKKMAGIQIPVQRLFDDLSTLEAAAGYILEEVPTFGATESFQVSTAISKEPLEAALPKATEPQLEPKAVERLIASQLQIMADQIEMLREAGSSVTLQELVEKVTEKKPALGKVVELQEIPDDAEEVKPVETTIKPVSREGELVLSSGQQRLWYLDQLVPNSPVYNLPEGFRLQGRLNLEALKQALNQIVNRHEVLRTTYAMGDKGPIQVISPSLELDVPVVDLSGSSKHEQEKELSRYLESVAWQPFDLSRGPLVRASLVKLGEEDHVLFFMPHHSVFDGWSFGIFQRELFSLYEAVAAGKKSTLPDLPIQYADFAAWQKVWLEGKEVEGHLAYWREIFSGELPVLELPTDYPRPALQSTRGSRAALRISKVKVDSLSKLGRSEGATFFMVLLAAFNTLLHRYTSQEDIIVGAPIAGRAWPETTDLIGFFVNTLVFRTNLGGNPSFRELLRRVREVCLGAYKHQDLPFQRLVEELQPERDLSRTPVYQAMLAFEASAENSLAPGIFWNRHRIPSKVSQTDLTLWVVEVEDGLSLELEYSPDLFKADTIKRMAGHLEVILKEIIQDPEMKIGELPLLTKPEIEQLAVWNDTWTDYPRDACVRHLFEAQAEKTPEKVAVVYEQTRLTYHELNERANMLAHYLRKLGVGPDALVGIYVERCAEMMVGLLGILKAGGAYVPLDPDYPKERLSYMIEDAQMGVLVTQERFKGELPENAARIVYLDAEWEQISKESHSNPVSNAKPDNLAYVIYTSGSTGKPKGVQVRLGGVVNFLLSVAEKPGFTENDVLLAVTTLSFDIHVLELYLPLVVGGKVCVVRREVASDGIGLLDALKNSEATVMQATPTTWRLLLAAGWEGSNRLKVLCGGEAFPPDLARELVKRAGSVWNMYGPTETTVWSTVYPLVDSEGQIFIGRPIANTTVHILDKHLQPVPVGVPGELHIGGDGITRGYWNRPELTADRFIPDPFRKDAGARLYKTGDLARYRSDGNLEYLNRIDNQVKVRGFRIELGEIETALGKHEALKQSAVIVKEVRPGDTRLVAYVVANPGQTITSTELRRHLREQLPEYMIPQHFVELDKLPLTPAGKIDRKGLTASFKLGAAGEEEYVSPRTDTEKMLAGIWKEIMGVERVSAHDNFFEIGGHSLLAMLVIAKIRSTTGVQLSPRSLLLDTLRQIAAAHPFPASEQKQIEKEGLEGAKSEALLKTLFQRFRVRVLRTKK
jgi:amino acid adenylation domain-containing protein